MTHVNYLSLGRGIGIAMLVEFIVSIIGLIAIWFMTASASDAVVVCLVVLIVIALIKKVRHDTNRKD